MFAKYSGVSPSNDILYLVAAGSRVLLGAGLGPADLHGVPDPTTDPAQPLAQSQAPHPFLHALQLPVHHRRRHHLLLHF